MAKNIMNIEINESQYAHYHQKGILSKELDEDSVFIISPNLNKNLSQLSWGPDFDLILFVPITSFIPPH